MPDTVTSVAFFFFACVHSVGLAYISSDLRTCTQRMFARNISATESVNSSPQYGGGHLRVHYDVCNVCEFWKGKFEPIANSAPPCPVFLFPFVPVSLSLSLSLSLLFSFSLFLFLSLSLSLSLSLLSLSLSLSLSLLAHLTHNYGRTPP